MACFLSKKTTLADRKSETTDLPKDLCSNPIEEGHRDAPVEREDLGETSVESEFKLRLDGKHLFKYFKMEFYKPFCECII